MASAADMVGQIPAVDECGKGVAADARNDRRHAVMEPLTIIVEFHGKSERVVSNSDSLGSPLMATLDQQIRR